MKVFHRMVEQWTPDVQLLDIEPVESLEVFVRRLEERPLVALEVDRHRERHHRVGLETQSVDQLDPDVDVAILLGPDTLRRMQVVTGVPRRIETRGMRRD